MSTPQPPMNDATAGKPTEVDDANIRKVAVVIADFFSPEGHDPEEWAQMCQVAEKVLRALGLWGTQAVAAETEKLRKALEQARRELMSHAHAEHCISMALAVVDAALSAHPATPPISRVDGL